MCLSGQDMFASDAVSPLNDLQFFFIQTCRENTANGGGGGGTGGGATTAALFVSYCRKKEIYAKYMNVT